MAIAVRQASSAQSSARVGRCATDGRTMTTSSSVTTHSGTVVQRYAPANTMRAQPMRKRRRSAAADVSERGFGVVVLVLMTVVPRVVILVLLEIDLVEDH